MEALSSIRHYILRLIEHPEVKGLFSVLCVALTEIFGTFSEPLQLLLILVVVDLITGLAKGAKYKDVNSTTIRQSLWKIAEYLIFIFLGNMGERVVAAGLGISGFRGLVIFWINITELISITENLDELGFDIPNFVSRYLKKRKKEAVKKERK